MVSAAAAAGRWRQFPPHRAGKRSSGHQREHVRVVHVERLGLVGQRHRRRRGNALPSRERHVAYSRRAFFRHFRQVIEQMTIIAQPTTSAAFELKTR